MITIILLAFGSAVFPLLLAGVAIVLTRPKPRSLLLALYAGGMLTSLICGAIALWGFRSARSVTTNTASSPHPGTSLLEGALALALAWLLASGRVHTLIERWRSRHRHHRFRRKKEGPPWLERRLKDASAPIAFAVGMVISLPGPLYLLALGDIATGPYRPGEQVALIVLFNVIMFLLLEVPLVGYLLRPDLTAALVATLGHWLKANRYRLMGGVIGLFGVSLLVRGIVGLA